MSCPAFALGLLGAIRSPGAIALIGAIAGIAGATVGALAGGFSTYKIEDHRQEFQRKRDERAERRERERELATLRGIARVWRTQLDDLRHLLSQAIDPGHTLEWWEDEFDVETAMSTEDMKAVAAVAAGAEWDRIDLGLSAVRAITAMRSADWKENDGKMRAEDRAIAKKALGQIVKAMDVLQDIAERSPTGAGERDEA